MKQKCAICFSEIKADCDYRQGRCPHRPALVNVTIPESYKTRFYNLINFIKNIFK
jgi:hypothetical protein